MSVMTNTAAKPVVAVIAPIAAALSPVAEPMVRVAAGLLLVPHGAQKLFGWFGGYGLEATGQFFVTKLGLPASLALLTGLIEFGGGLLLAAGLATRAAAALVVAMMAVAVLYVHLGAGFSGRAAGTNIPCCGASSRSRTRSAAAALTRWTP